MQQWGKTLENYFNFTAIVFDPYVCDEYSCARNFFLIYLHQGLVYTRRYLSFQNKIVCQRKE